jgi:hypothetical protein
MISTISQYALLIIVYHRYRYVCFIPWPTPRNWEWGAVKNEIVRQKRWFQFSHCELSIHM